MLGPSAGENTCLQDDCTIFSKNTLGRKNETALKELWGAGSFICSIWDLSGVSHRGRREATHTQVCRGMALPGEVLGEAQSHRA